MRVKLIKIDEKNPLREEYVMANNMQFLYNAAKDVLKTALANLIKKVEQAHKDIDWSRVHDVKIQDDGIELITYEHPLEAQVGPMSKEEIQRVEGLRSQIAKDVSQSESKKVWN